MGFWKAFKAGAEKHVLQGVIIHYRFTIEKYLNKAFSKVRRPEHKDLQNRKKNIIIETRYFWLKSKKNFTKTNKSDFRELNIDQSAGSREWKCKTRFRYFLGYIYKGSAQKFLKKWYFSTTHSRLKPVIDEATMLIGHIENILTDFKQRIKNAFTEGINSKIQHNKATSPKFRILNNYRTTILFYFEKLCLYLLKNKKNQKRGVINAW